MAKKNRAGASVDAEAVVELSDRRLSPLRVSIAIVVLLAVVAAGFFGARTWASTQADPSQAQPWFAGYVDVTATPTYEFETQGSTDTPDAVLSFIVSSTTDACTPSWGSAYTLEQAGDTLDLDRRIARLQQGGGSIAVSFGGLLNDELAVNCTDETKLEAAYASVLDRYKVGTIDLDLEGAGLTDTAAVERRASAIATLQEQRRAAGDPMAVWLTLPVAPTGLTEDGTDAVSAMLKAGVDLAGVNAMTMDYGSSRSVGDSMAEASEQALTATQRQLGVLYSRAGINLGDATLWSKIGATPMIGQNDVVDEVFSLKDAKLLNAWVADKGLGRMSMWSANRDKTCGSNYTTTSIVSDACSGVDQGDLFFADLLSGGFDGSLAAGESAAATTSEPTQAAEIADDPATSPYPIWSSDASYLKGTKVVWHRNVYTAKWWTKAEVPDNPVLNDWESPWQLVGPVLEGETPIPQASLPAGTFPEWTGDATYQKGDRILFSGVPYEAKWWTQADSPEASASDPDSSPWEPLTQADITAIASGTPAG
ncbi:chitinase [Leifsonia sp. Leaf264]|uniref:chitinase n=1 Tax=Leifsonia sp. Leaf264 TaxID=1736314 RepID=UPI0006F67F92|nr:carbohydrate-binding protein [Leifsonia sp. Leaf264]KQO99682.1 glycosyl hydrolase family 18 [Leifsonia sp. Leaf264]